MNDDPRHNRTVSIGEIVGPIAAKFDAMLGDDAFWARRHAEIAAHDTSERQRRAQQRSATRERRWNEIPAEYREDFIPSKSKLPRAIIAAVQRWTPDRSGIGICLGGQTGAGKTRLLVRLLHRLTCSWRYVPATKFADAVRKQYDDDWGVANRAAILIDETRDVRVLMLDDLGQENATESVSEALMDLIEHRTSKRMPILWTTNRASADLKRHYKDRGPAIVRRLQEFTVTPSEE